MGAYDRLNLGKDSSNRDLVVNRRTAAMLHDAERRIGEKFTIIQGSYVKPGSGAAASALTHAGGGVVDLRTWDLDVDPRQAVKALRKSGFAAWYRDKPAFDPHIHAVALGDKQAHPQAKQQMKDYRHHLNGLANRGPDDGPRIRTIRVWEHVKRMVAVTLAKRELERWRKAHSG